MNVLRLISQLIGIETLRLTHYFGKTTLINQNSLYIIIPNHKGYDKRVTVGQLDIS